MVKKVITTENDVKKLVKKVFDDAGAWSYAPIQTGMGAHGIPDRVGCVPVTVTPEMVGQTFGLFVAVEAKRPGRRGEKNAGATGQQVAQLQGILDAHGVAALVDSKEDTEWLSFMLTLARDVHLSHYAARVLTDRITGKDNG